MTALVAASKAEPASGATLQEMANILDMIIAAKGGSPDPAEDGEGPDSREEEAAGSGSDGEAEDSSDEDNGGFGPGWERRRRRSPCAERGNVHDWPLRSPLSHSSDSDDEPTCTADR